MSMLNFKHGLYAGLQTITPSTATAGTIYVTTDEKAMYVDLPVGSSVQRIRLSQIVNIPTTAEWNALKPPYSTEAFYYIVDANALLKFTGSDWVQINSTAEIEGILAKMGFHSSKPTNPVKGDIYTKADGTNEIYTGEKWVAFTNLGTNVLDLDSRLTALESTVDDLGEALQQEITDRETADTNLQNLITDLSSAINYIGKGSLADRPATPALGSVYIVVGADGSETVYVYKSKTPTEAEWSSDAAALGAQINTLRLRIEAVAAVAGDTSALEALQSALDDLTEAYDALVKDATIKTFKGIEDALAGVNQTIENLGDTYATLQQLQEAKEAVLGKDEKGVVSTETVASVNAKAVKNASDIKDAQDAYDALIKDATELKTFAAVEGALSGINQTISKLDDTYATDDELKTAKEAILGKDDKGTVTTETVASVDAKAVKNASDIKDTQDAYDALIKDATITTFKGMEDVIGQVNKTISDLDKTYATDAELDTATKTILGTDEGGQVFNGTVLTVNGKAEKNADDIAELQDDVDELRDDLLSKIQTADAMIYRGTVATANDLTTKSAAIGGAHVGDTYKATAEFTLGDVKVNIGDLLIARGTEENGIITSATLDWDHVPSGYVANYNPELELESNSTNNVATVRLTSAHADEQSSGDLGAFNIAGATNSAISVTVDENNTVAIGMTWGTF